MREPLTWSLPLGRLFGATVRMHVMLPLVMLAAYLKVVGEKTAPPDIGIAAGAVLGLLFLSILLHEFGHVFTARAVGGDCDEVILWPLGGLAMCDLPHSPRAHLWTALGGPFVNMALCICTAAFLAVLGVWPAFNLFSTDPYFPPLLAVGTGEPVTPVWFLTLAARVFWINWALFWFNLIPAFPLDGGRVVQSILWSRGDFRDSLVTAAYVGFAAMFVIFVVSIFKDSVLLFALCAFIYLHCRMALIQGEGGHTEGMVGAGDESTLGYDFSAGYTSLDREAQAPPRRRPRPNFFQRWMQRRAADRARRDIEEREDEERRMDELLAKVHAHGRDSLTDEEKRFMSRVSERYRGK